ncbi:MAG: pilus assembly protein PilP [Myxococcales bacterium]|nr:pilus assembly protein PilP [Myxococcales bacterium]
MTSMRAFFKPVGCGADRLIWAGLLCAGLWACGGSAPPPGPGLMPGAAPAGPAPTVDASQLKLDLDLPEESTPVVTYIYTPVGKRDPFRSQYKTLTPEKAKTSELSATCPLCKFELDQLKLVAIISGMAQPSAMVEDPTGKGWVIRIGTRIGKNAGRVFRIKPDEVVIAEDYRDYNQRPVTNYISIFLKKAEEKQD